MQLKLKIHGICQITQFDNEAYSHKGSLAWDIASRETDKELGYSVNVDVVCKAVDKKYAFTWWQTVEPVELADGSKDYATLMFGHDNSINAYVGMNVKANVRLGNMGTGGNAQGSHVHLEVAKGQFKGNWYQNQYGVYVLYNQAPIHELIYMDDLELVEVYQDYRQVLFDERKALFKYTEKEDEAMHKVIDVSNWQPTIDYAKVKSSGIKGVILRAGVTYWGKIEVSKDESFEKHYKGFKNVGMPIGAYYYSAANTVAKAKEEANALLSYIKGKKFEYPIYFDVENKERQQGLSKQALTDITKAFLEVVEKAGYYVGIYASKSWLESELDMAQLKDYDVWLAQYNTTATYKGNYGMWQYTSSGKVNGISGNVDMNNCYKDYPSIIKSAGLNGYGTSQKPSQNDEIEKLKQELANVKKLLETANNEVTRLKKKVNEARAILNAN